MLTIRLPESARLDSTDLAVITRAFAVDPTRVVIDLRIVPVAGSDVRTRLPGDELRAARLNAFVDASGLARALVIDALVAPSERVRHVGGAIIADDARASVAATGRPFAEGADAWAQRDGAVIAGSARTPKRIVMIADATSLVPRALLALVSAGRATLVMQHASPNAATSALLDESSMVSTVRIPISAGWFVRVRTGEMLHADGSVGMVADTVVALPVSASDRAQAERRPCQRSLGAGASSGSSTSNRRMIGPRSRYENHVTVATCFGSRCAIRSSRNAFVNCSQ